MFCIGDPVVTTVYMIGGRSAEVAGTVTAVVVSRRDPERVVSYTVDASGSGYGLLCVEAPKARRP